MERHVYGLQASRDSGVQSSSGLRTQEFRTRDSGVQFRNWSRFHRTQHALMLIDVHGTFTLLSIVLFRGKGPCAVGAQL
eukprot:scaffold116792_cov17-Tisochrysis_lutea.AAC.1